MILVLGGTTEGRRAVETLEKAGKPFYYSTKSELQVIETHNAMRITGGLNLQTMTELCRVKEIRMIVDAAHPFASLLHDTAVEAGKTLSIPVVRYERKYPERDKRVIWCKDYDDAIDKMINDEVANLLALTGVQTISKLKRFWKEHDCHFRILDREESFLKAEEAGFPKEKLCFYGDSTDIVPLFNEYHPDAIITKESGETGGFKEKVEEALSNGVRVYAIERPKLPEYMAIVNGQYGLRKEVERIVPGFYELRSGFTTGACATAAAKAALLALVCDEESEFVTFTIPDGEVMQMKTESVRIIDRETAEASVVKDAGDDPDVTDGCRILAKVSLANHSNVHFHGGEGIGTVTLPGVGLNIGEPAINPVPRQMMRNELLKIYPKGCDLTISVPGGEELAKRTFNSRIGIVGGISIIGTSGIVMPFSNEAFMEAIKRELEVAIALGCERVVLNSGARSEKVVKTQYHDLPAAAFVHYGNAIGETLKLAAELKIKRLTVGLMIGKAVKLAEGNTDTHSHKVTMNRDFLMKTAREACCSEVALDTLKNINMARELWTELTSHDADKFFPYLLGLCMATCRTCYPKGDLTLMLITDSSEVFCSI